MTTVKQLVDRPGCLSTLSMDVRHRQQRELTQAGKIMLQHVPSARYAAVCQDVVMAIVEQLHKGRRHGK